MLVEKDMLVGRTRTRSGSRTGKPAPSGWPVLLLGRADSRVVPSGGSSIRGENPVVPRRPRDQLLINSCYESIRRNPQSQSSWKSELVEAARMFESTDTLSGAAVRWLARTEHVISAHGARDNSSTVERSQGPLVPPLPLSLQQTPQT